MHIHSICSISNCKCLGTDPTFYWICVSAQHSDCQCAYNRHLHQGKQALTSINAKEISIVSKKWVLNYVESKGCYIYIKETAASSVLSRQMDS